MKVWLFLIFSECFCISQIHTLSVSVNYMDDLPTNIIEIIDDTVTKLSHSIILRSYERNFTHLSRKEACASKWVYGPNKGECGGVAKNYEDLCGEAHIPMEHLDGLQIYNLKDVEPQPYSLPRGSGFPHAVEFVLYVTLRSDLKCLVMNAYADVCREGTYLVGGSVSGRPLAGAINLCPDALMGFSEMELKRTVAHEFIHLLGFNFGSSRHFIMCQRMEKCENDNDCHRTFINNDDNADIHCSKRSEVIIVNDRGELEIVSPNVMLAAGLRDQENAESIGNDVVCDLIEKSILEDSNESHGPLLASTQSGVHWTRKSFMSSVMAPSLSLNSQVHVDLMTVALLLDSGWYCIDLSNLCKLNLILNDIEDQNITSLFGCHSQMSEEKLPVQGTSNVEPTDKSERKQHEETPELQYQYTTEIYYDKGVEGKAIEESEAGYSTDINRSYKFSSEKSSSNKLNTYPFLLLVFMLYFGPHHLLHGEGFVLV